MSNLSQFSTGAIKSIQRGTTAITGTNLTGTSTITAVDTAKSELRVLGWSAYYDNIQVSPRLSLTNTTTITATRGGNGSGVGVTTTVSWELTEWR